MPKIRRINLIAGPGHGKSTLAASLFAEFKNRRPEFGLSIELVTEFVKPWTYLGRSPAGFDQMFITASQMQMEEIPLRGGTDLIITDSPLILGEYYAPTALKNSIRFANAAFEAAYPSLNVFIDYKRPFYQEGRYHDEAAANRVHFELKNMLIRDSANSLVLREESTPDKIVKSIYNAIL